MNINNNVRVRVIQRPIFFNNKPTLAQLPQKQSYRTPQNRSPLVHSQQISPLRKRPNFSFHEFLKPVQPLPHKPNFELGNQVTMTQRPPGLPAKKLIPSFFGSKVGDENTRMNPNFEYVLKYTIRTRKGHGVANKIKNQDAYIVSPNINQKSYQHFFCVCDGHGIFGHQVSLFLKQQFPIFIQKNQNQLKLQPVAILLQIFREISEKLKASQIDIAYSGSTVVSVLMIHNKIYCANLGDSRAVKIRKHNQRWLPMRLSRDHKPSQQDEAERIVNQGGRIDAFKDGQGNPNGPLRVWSNQTVPGLAMTRSMGDEVAKSVGVTSVPEIKTFDVCDEDKIFLLGTDGLFEFLSEDQIMECLLPYYENQELDQACEALMGLAISSWQQKCSFVDDITFILIFMTY